MTGRLPQRPNTHQLEEESRRFFEGSLPLNWTCDIPQNDYGIDARIGIAIGNSVTGQGLVVQLKASATDSGLETVSVRLPVATYNVLWEMLEVALLVKYVAAEESAYWILWKDITSPNQQQASFTVHLPRANKLSRESWIVIAQHVQFVHRTKLAALGQR